MLARMDLTLQSDGQVTSSEVADELMPLTQAEEMFCLAILDYAGNIKAATQSVYGDVKSPIQYGQVLLANPRIRDRIKELQESLQQNSLITLGSHIAELANIRDMGKMIGNIKVALEAEKMRGVVAGLYIGKEGANAGSRGGNTVAVQVVIGNSNPHDQNV